MPVIDKPSEPKSTRANDTAVKALLAPFTVAPAVQRRSAHASNDLHDQHRSTPLDAKRNGLSAGES
jgi:hypothetical protein